MCHCVTNDGLMIHTIVYAIILCVQVKLLNETIKQQDAKLQESSMIKVLATYMQMVGICIAY